MAFFDSVGGSSGSTIKLNRTSMGLSANTLFHFTPKVEYLVSILEDGFVPRFCLEDLSLYYAGEALSMKSPVMKLAIPMTCFCDIRLTQLGIHTGIYGRFAIGLNKEWGLKNRISPITYYHKNSPTSTALAKAVNFLSDDVRRMSRKTVEELRSLPSLDPIPSDIQQAMSLISTLAYFYKPLEGKQMVKGGEQTLYFYDEREWRYFSPPSIRSEHRYFLLEEEFNDANIRNTEQQKLVSARLDFSIKDIEYIIVPNREFLREFKSIMQSARRIKFEHIASKIEILEDIEQDH